MDKISPFFKEVVNRSFGKEADNIIKNSLLLQYLGIKTLSVNKDSKSRGNLASLYAIYVLVEDYLRNNFDKKNNYSKYKGAEFSVLFKRQRELPFGEKLQNHALNNRCNDEFRKFFQNSKEVPIIRDLKTKRYWINEDLLLVKVNSKTYNNSECIIEVIKEYSNLRTEKFASFFDSCISLKKKFNKDKFIELVKAQLLPQVDARIFEIASFCILKSYYSLNGLILYKTGRTNANDGGIDFVMRPSGRFFQVSEVLDFKKYFLEIEKINRYPITFVIKSLKQPKELKKIIIEKAKSNYDKKTLKKFKESIEEIVSIPILIERLEEVIKKRREKKLLDDLILYYKVEFHLN